MRRNDRSDESSLRCSFCRKSQKTVGKLISNPSVDSVRVYICDECVAVCAAIIEDDKIEAGIDQAAALDIAEPAHPLLTHPLASDLMAAIQLWVLEESLGNDGLAAMAQVRTIANAICRLG